MNHKDLRILQDLQQKILFEVDKLCRKHDIEYMLAYGTLLGAVRHKGFIPWDNDVDIFMTRENHKKFLSVAHELPDTFRLWHVCYSDIDHAGLTRVINPDEKFKNVCIDIFILDYQKKYSLIQGVIYRFCAFLHIAKLSDSEKKILKDRFAGFKLKKFVLWLSRGANVIFGGSARIEKLIFKLRVSPDSTDSYIILEGHERFPVKSLQDICDMSFGEYIFKCPSHYEEILKIMYGDYMQIPKEGLEWMEQERLTLQEVE